MKKRLVILCSMVIILLVGIVVYFQLPQWLVRGHPEALAGGAASGAVPGELRDSADEEPLAACPQR